ncbi:MAG: glycosyltransferase family 39 protein [Anaerolineae bacterium]|nr:glycosyltransferase family 39 protein [Anaerolineae bacterium]
MTRFKTLKQYTPLLAVVLFYMVLAVAYASLVPLGEVPDEPAHVNYARFLAERGHLPTTLAEREAAGYRSAWPPLYHLLVSRPFVAMDDIPPTHLKSVGDTPRRLIPTNGQTIAAFIHTEDEAWPWQGITLAWHLGRFISVLFTGLTVIITYLIARRLTARQDIAAATAALTAFIPQVLFIGSAVSDDNLLITLAALIFLILVIYTQRATLPGIGLMFFLGLLLGLATVTKYNTLPLWAITLLWLGWLSLGRHRTRVSKPFVTLLNRMIVLLLGAALTAGWWFIFIWRNFNQVNARGWLSGSLAALTAGTADASLRQLGRGSTVALPPLTAWLEWFSTLFTSFWGLFGGGATIKLPGWGYWLLAFFCLLAITSVLFQIFRAPAATTRNLPLHLFLLTPVFFLALPILRFILTGNIVETAQGRHLFPALPAITLALVWGLSKLNLRHLPGQRMLPAIRFIFNPFLLPLVLVSYTFLLSLYALFLIHSRYPPLLPLRTTPQAATAKNIVKTKLANGIILLGYQLDSAAAGVLPVTLVWQADAIPTQDYLINLTVADSAGLPLGGWLGHPVGGRYPTRAWDNGDILVDAIPIPLLPGVSANNAILTLQLLDSTVQPATEPLTLTTHLSLPSALWPASPLLPPHLRADDLPPESPFTYRSTLSFILPGVTTPPDLIAPSGQSFAPARFISGSNGNLAYFMVQVHWPSGDYQLSQLPAPSPSFPIKNRPRQFEPPPLEYHVNANFADHLTLLGYDLPQRRVQPGQSFPVTLHLRAERPIGRNLVIFNHLLNQQATQYGGEDRIPLQYYTTLLWVPGEIVSDTYPVPVDPTAPPGIYWLDVGFYPDDQPEFSLPLFANGRPLNRNSVRLVPVKVGGPPPDVTIDAANPQHPIHQTFDQQISLLGFNLSDKNGSPITNLQRVPRNSQLTFFWQPQTIPQADYTVFIHLLNRNRNLVAQFDGPPARGSYPTSLWDPGEIIVDPHLVGDLTPGHYTLQVGLYRPGTGERLPLAETPENALELLAFEVGD